MRALIVDDEPLAREWVRTLLADEEDVEVIGECGDGNEAVRVIEAERPDVVFLDVQMPGLSGFEVLARIPAANMPLIIMVTAYDDFALRAINAHAMDYLLKPFAPERFQAALARVRMQLLGRTREDMETHLRELISAGQPKEYLTRFMVKRGQRFVIIGANDVKWIEAADNYVKLHTEKGTEQLRATLHTLESRLDPTRFVRVHRGAIVNVGAIESLEPWGQGEYLLSLSGGFQVASSRTFRLRIRQALGASLHPE